MTTGQGREHILMPSAMTESLEPGMLVEACLSASSSQISDIRAGQWGQTLIPPSLKAFVQQVRTMTNSVVLKIRSRMDTFEVKLPQGQELPPAYCTVLATPTLQEGSLEGLSGIVRVLAPPAITKPMKHEILSPASSNVLASVLKVDTDLSSPYALSPFKNGT